MAAVERNELPDEAGIPSTEIEALESTVSVVSDDTGDDDESSGDEYSSSDEEETEVDESKADDIDGIGDEDSNGNHAAPVPAPTPAPAPIVALPSTPTVPALYNAELDPDLESKNIILAVLTHGAKCQARKRCPFPNCVESKSMVRHVSRCTDVQCSISYCANSRFVLKHAQQIQAAILNLARRNATSKPGILQRAAAAAAVASANGRRRAAPKRQFSSTMPRWEAQKLSPILEGDNEDADENDSLGESDDEYESTNEDQNRNAKASYANKKEYDSYDTFDDASREGIGATSVDTTDSNSTGKLAFYTDEEDSDSSEEESEHAPFLVSSMPSGESSDQNDSVDNQSDQDGNAINQQFKSKWDVEYSDEEDDGVDDHKPVTSNWEVEYSDGEEEEDNDDDDINDDDGGQKEFLRSRTWKGSKSGYVFRTTKETGTGYYRDRYEKPPDNSSQWVVEYSDDEEDSDEPESKIPKKAASASNWDKDSSDDEEVDWQEQRRASPRRPAKPPSKPVSSGKSSNWVIEYSDDEDDEEEEDETRNSRQEIDSLPIPPTMFKDDLDGDDPYSDSESSGEEGYLTAESVISAVGLAESEENKSQIENEPPAEGGAETCGQSGIVDSVEIGAKITEPQSITDEGDASNELQSTENAIFAGLLDPITEPCFAKASHPSAPDGQTDLKSLGKGESDSLEKVVDDDSDADRKAALLNNPLYVSYDNSTDEILDVSDRRNPALGIDCVTENVEDENEDADGIPFKTIPSEKSSSRDATQTHHGQEKIIPLQGSPDKVELLNNAENIPMADESTEPMLVTEHLLGGSEPELMEGGNDNPVLVATERFDSCDASADDATQNDLNSGCFKTEAHIVSSLVESDPPKSTNGEQQANEASDADLLAEKGSEDVNEVVVVNEKGSRDSIPATKEADLSPLPKDKVAAAIDSAAETGSEETNEKDLNLVALTPTDTEENATLEAERRESITIITEPESLVGVTTEDNEDPEMPRTFFDSSMSSIAHGLELVSASSDDRKIHHNVRYRSVTGFLQLSPEEIRFISYDDDGGGCQVQEPIYIVWGDITKLQISPAPHAFTKIVLFSGKWHAFQLNSRELMEFVRVDIKTHMKAYGKSVDKAMVLLKRSSVMNLPDTPHDCGTELDGMAVERISQPSIKEEKPNCSQQIVGAVSGCANQVSAKKETSADGSKTITGRTVSANDDMKDIASVYAPVKFKGHTGALNVGKGLLSFKSSDNTEFPLTKTFPYTSIAKHQVSPQSQPKAMLKLVSPDGKAATFEVENRAILEKLKKEISRRRRDHKSTQEEAELTIGNQNTGTVKAGDKEKSKHRSLFYDNVIFQNMTGTVQLSKNTFRFAAHSPEFSAKSRDIMLRNVTKHQANPKSHIKALLKLVLTSGKSLLFELPSRVELQRIRKEISSLLKYQDQATPTESQQASASIIETEAQDDFTAALNKLGSVLSNGANSENQQKEIRRDQPSPPPPESAMANLLETKTTEKDANEL